ncbi:hypothetical protein [Asaia prunellae]|uniref:hypothetical protein n=1 Tax=Asaia prunellae TaxID=610245 RepID=UPI0004709598|nr:hypothetical protein [Asaia prunellae]
MVQNAISVVMGLILGLFTLIISVIALIEASARKALVALGIPQQIQGALLALLLLVLIVASFRLFGRLFGVLIAIVLVAFLLQALFVPDIRTVTF